MRHFLSLADLTPADLRALLDAAIAMKAARAGLPKGALDPEPSLPGRTLAAIFEKNSTRTRFSFEQAMRQAGGSIITVNASDMQLGRGEPVRDTARVLSRYVDAVMLRVNRHETLTEFAEWAEVPVVNGLSDFNHPCQIVADLLTLEERGITLAGARIAWVGDGNNVARSFLHAAPLAGFTLAISSPDAYSLSGQELGAAGASVEVADTPEACVEAADAVVTDCWVSMGDEDYDERVRALTPYRVTETLMSRAKADAPFLHCLPAYRDKEVEATVIEGEASVVWDEAENRLHAQKAVLSFLL